MLVIKPIQDKSEQEKLVKACGGVYAENSFAYSACDCTDDAQTTRFTIGVCQFAIQNDTGVISLLRCMDGVEDEEALMIMTRAATGFLSRCGVRYAVIHPDAADARLCEKLGFYRQEDSSWFLDIYKFYTTPCEDRQ